jgi:hypothetical protein
MTLVRSGSPHYFFCAYSSELNYNRLAYDVHATENLQLKAQLLERDMLHRQKVLDSFMHRKLVA